MKTLYLECKMGISGDMFLGALLDLLPNPDKWIEDFNSIGIPNVQSSYKRMAKCGVYGTHVSILANDKEEISEDISMKHIAADGSMHCHDTKEHMHSHEHNHGHGHSHSHGHEHIHDHNHNHEHSHVHNHSHVHEHSHTGLGDIEAIIDKLRVSDRVKKDAKAIYRLIAEAEASVHHSTVEQIHFHEVGALDAVADIVGGCMLVEALDPDRILASPVHVGSGHVRCAHGILPVPAPATAVLLHKVPFYSGQIEGELCTPTGAALLSYFADNFGPIPILSSAKTGYGMGSKDFAVANMLRAFWGDNWEAEGENQKPAGDAAPEEAFPAKDALQGDPLISELRCTLDDMAPEAIGNVQELLLGEGALDVTILPAQMKKNRPGQLLCVSCKKGDEDKMAKLLFCHTSTAGIRKLSYERYTLCYDFLTVATEYGEIRVKHYTGYGTEKYKPEYEDTALAARLHKTSFLAVYQAALHAALHKDR